MTKPELERLMGQPEQEWLDWKKAPPRGLELNRREPQHMVARGVLLRDLLALANASTQGPRYLVWGILDTKARRIAFGFDPCGFDDATFQAWVENAIEPHVSFVYTEVPWDDGKVVGVFTVFPSPDGPFVSREDVGDDLHKGQVVFRRGTKNTVAVRGDLDSLFSDTGVRLDVGFPLSRGEVSSELRLPAFDPRSLAREFLRERGGALAATLDELRLEVCRRNEKLADARAVEERASSDLDLDSETTKIAKLLARRDALDDLFGRKPVSVSAKRVAALATRLGELGLPASEDEFRFEDLHGTRQLGFERTTEFSGADKRKFELFCDLERQSEDLLHELREYVRVRQYEPVEVLGRNTGRTAAHKLEVTVASVSDPRIELYAQRPDLRPVPERESSRLDAILRPPSIGAYAPARVYEVEPIAESNNRVELLVPGAARTLDRLAVGVQRPGSFLLRVEVRGQDIPRPLEFLLTVEVVALDPEKDAGGR